MLVMDILKSNRKILGLAAKLKLIRNSRAGIRFSRITYRARKGENECKNRGEGLENSYTKDEQLREDAERLLRQRTKEPI